MTGINIPSLLVSAIAVGISGISLYWAFKSWKETYRPLITARVTTDESIVDQLTSLNLVVSNTGNRPAKNVKLTVNRNDLANALFADPEDTVRKDVERCFSEVITVIANDASVSNSFGRFSVNPKAKTWREPTIINIHIGYEDLGGKKYGNDQPLRIGARTDEAFAGGSW